MSGEYLQPARSATAAGQTRRAGFELEFAGIPLDAVVDSVIDHLPGTVNKLSEAEYEVETEALGKFRIELDWQFVKARARERVETRESEQASNPEDDTLMEQLTRIAGQVVPAELVCPPVPLDRLAELDPVVNTLRKRGARGTGGSPIYAFGVHINPELPDTGTATVLAYLQAFLVAQDWLIETNAVDLTRRITPYIDRFPADYLVRVLEAGDELPLETLIDDYLEFNPTRNRALDMLPLFRHLDADRVDNALDDSRINARPTLHYRLPNCEIEQPDWGLYRSWNLWCVVEHLATEPSLLARFRREALEFHGRLITLGEPPWHPELDRIQQDLLSA